MTVYNGRSKAFRAERLRLFEEGKRRCITCHRVKRIATCYTTSVRGANGINGQCNHCRRSSHRKRYSGLYEALRDGERRARKAGLRADHFSPGELMDYWRSVGIDPWVCAVTGEQLTQATRNVDHVQPLDAPDSAGHTITNVVPVLAEYNRWKGSKSVVEALASWWDAPGNDPKDPEGIEGAFVIEGWFEPERGSVER
ncbi:hypothetical protein CUROG_04585 [Corynebacterium urogenitale]|uniref:HNH endonuclease n=1 Tax=Corynebacterium urogenitale TaxID=2487892 RepID=A0A5J6Z7S9_9CORY|nr:hypothetical protein CUROG_04585 [Corynebacterium urogenitale]